MAQGLRRAVKPVSRQVGATDQKSRRHKPSPGSQRRLLKCSRPSDVRKLAAKQKPPSPFSESDLGRSENSPQGFLGSVLDGGRSSRGPVPILFCLEVRCATVIAVATVAGTRQHAAAARAAQPLPPARPPARRGPRGARAAAHRPGQPARARHAGVRGHRGQHVPCCCSHGGAVAAVASCGVRTCTAKGRDCEFKGTCVALEGTICGFRNKVGLQTDALDNKTRDKGAVDSALEPRRPPLTTPLTVGGLLAGGRRAGGRGFSIVPLRGGQDHCTVPRHLLKVITRAPLRLFHPRKSTVTAPTPRPWTESSPRSRSGRPAASPGAAASTSPRLRRPLRTT